MKKKYTIRMLQIDSILNGRSWRIEVKKTGKWVEAAIAYEGDATFYKKEEADKWYEHLCAKGQVKKTLLKQQ